MPSFNGHKNWNHWNISFWINNDEYLYSIAKNCLERYPNSSESAARHALQRLKDEGIYRTPDGAPYSISAIHWAMFVM